MLISTAQYYSKVLNFEIVKVLNALQHHNLVQNSITPKFYVELFKQIYIFIFILSHPPG
jgi:hypothetical protein